MGKRKKKTRSIYTRCATSALHQDGVQLSNEFVQGRKMQIAFKAEILPRVGKRARKFDQYICMNCINLITAETGIPYTKSRPGVNSQHLNPETDCDKLSVNSDSSTDNSQLSDFAEGSSFNVLGQYNDIVDGQYHALAQNDININDTVSNTCSYATKSSGLPNHLPEQLQVPNRISESTAQQGERPCQSVIFKKTLEVIPEHGVGLSQNMKPTISNSTFEHNQESIPEIEDDNVQGKGQRIVLEEHNLRQNIQSLSPELRAKLAYTLAAVERENIRLDARNLSKAENKSPTSLSELGSQDYLMGRNGVLMHFLTGLKDENYPESEIPLPLNSDTFQKSADTYKLAKVAEACMSLAAPLYVLPYHLREAILLYSVTKSRLALLLLASTAPYGSYLTVRNWLDNIGKTDSEGPLILLANDKGDFLGVFDNNQVITRRWNIRVEHKVMCSVVTIVIFVTMDPEGTLQYQEHLKPIHWMWRNLDEPKKQKLLQGHLSPNHQEIRCRKHLHPWLSTIIEQVVQEQIKVFDTFHDDVDREVNKLKQQEMDEKTCQNCGTKVKKRKRICPDCSERIGPPPKQSEEVTSMKGTNKMKRKSTDLDVTRVVVKRRNNGTYEFYEETPPTSEKPTEYDHLENLHPDIPPEVTIGRPLFVNPCSYQAVADVFRDIGKQAGIRAYGGIREWLTIVSDGLPYILGYQIIERTFKCEFCGDSFHGTAECMAHKKVHQGRCSLKREFDWILLQPGPGHIEMNMIRTYVKFVWPIYWENMVEIFNFKSEQAKRSARCVSDHHKGMVLARIARESFAKELVLPYVRKGLKENCNDFSVAGFLNFAMQEAKSPNYSLMFELVFSILEGIFQYRSGVRSGDTELMESGKRLFSRMWCAQSHPLYRQLSAYDSIMHECMPTAVFEHVQKTKSLNLSGVPFSGEGADFKLEVVNKSVQNWITGIPKDKDWSNTCANLPVLTKIRDTTFEETGVKDPKDQKSRKTYDLSSQVITWRAAIRKRNFVRLVDEQPTDDDSNSDIDSDADNSNEICNNSRGDNNKEPRNVKLKPPRSFNNKPLDRDLLKLVENAGKKETTYLERFIYHKERGFFLEKASVPFHEPPIFVTTEEREAYFNLKERSNKEIAALISLKLAEIENESMKQDYEGVFQKELLSKKNASKEDYIDFYEELQETLTISVIEDTGAIDLIEADED